MPSSTMPHVTEVLRDAGLVDVTWFSDEARERGSAVHKAVHYWLQGDLDRDSLDAQVLASVQQFERFVDESWLTLPVIATEEHVFAPTLGYCGTLDIRCVLDGHESIIDIKGACESPWHGVQLAAYAGCFVHPLQRYNLYLTADGYKLVRRQDRDDWKVFCAALTIANWRSKCLVK